MRAAAPSLFAAALLVGAAAAQGAEGTGGTLEQTKQELRQLQSDQKDKAGQVNDKARLSTPMLEVQAGEGSAEDWFTKKQAKERKLRLGRAEANPNWLAEGVAKLEKEEAQAKAPQPGPAREAVAKENTPQAPDPGDSQYLLKLFDEQKKAGDPKPSAAKVATPASPDPFAPFMESWLASSPARGQFFDQFAKKPEAAAANVPAGGPANYSRPPAATATAVAPVAAARESIAVEKSNPYLAELNAPILSQEIAGEARQLQPTVGAPPAAAGTAKSGPVLPPAGQGQDTRERAKAPLPGLTDDRKYFPQLKRF